jgi:hypothetical protein
LNFSGSFAWLMVQRERFSGQQKNGIDRLRENTDRLIHATCELDNGSGLRANGGPVDEIAGFGRCSWGFGRF